MWSLYITSSQWAGQTWHFKRWDDGKLHELLFYCALITPSLSLLLLLLPLLYPPPPLTHTHTVRCSLSPSLTSIVRYRVLGQDAGRMGRARAAELADGKRAGADSLKCLSTWEGDCRQNVTITVIVRKGDGLTFHARTAYINLEPGVETATLAILNIVLS